MVKEAMLPFFCSLASVFIVKANTEEAAAIASGVKYGKPQYAVGQKLKVKVENGIAYVEVFDLPPAEVIVLVNEP